MVIKFVSKSRDITYEYPIPNNVPREYGCGKIHKTEYDDRTLSVLQKDGVDHVHGSVNMMLSTYEDGAIYNFFRHKTEDGMEITFGWLNTDYNVFMENDEGKTVNRL